MLVFLFFIFFYFFFYFLFFFSLPSPNPLRFPTIFAQASTTATYFFSRQPCHLSFELPRFELDKLFFVKYLDNLRSNNREMFIISLWYKDS